MAIKFILFRCHKDDCWVVSRVYEKQQLCVGVVEAPDEYTARVAMQALEIREAMKEKGELPEMQKERPRTRPVPL
jgi:hypothetical protein